MRLKNIPIAKEVIQKNDCVIKEYKERRARWSDLFENKNPIYIEVGMGKGQFIMRMADAHPDINYIGIERYDSVLLRAVQKYLAVEHPPVNLRFICMDAAELPEVFDEGEVSRIYLNFSDPWPKARHARRRLTSRQFLARYDKILVPDGVVEFKTDNQELFSFSLEEIPKAGWEIIASTRDLHHDAAMMEENICTEYEEKFSAQGHPICKLITRRGGE